MTQTLTAEIQTLTATGLPSGTVLGSTTIPATNFPATSMREPVAFDFSSQNIPVQIGDQLAIVLTYDTISVDLSRPSWTGEVGFAATYAGGEALSNIFGPWGPLFSSSASDLEFQSFVLDIPPGIPGGNGTLFIIDAVEILGVGAEATNLGGIHKLAVDSFGGIGLQQDSNTIKTTFTFDAEGAPAGPVDAFVYGLLEGSLLADLGGTAGVTASLSLFDLGLNLLGSDSFLLNIAANLSELSTADIFETLGFGVQLIPGQQYILQGDLSVRANGVSQFGRGTALFNSTFEYTLSGLTENPFTAVPEPATFLLMGLGLVGLGFARRRRLNA